MGLRSNLPKDDIMKLFEMSNDMSIEMSDVKQSVDYLSTVIKSEEKISVEYFENGDDVPDPKDLNKEDKNLLIFDDVVLSKQSKIEDYYTRGRHSNVDCFYLSQNYFMLPRRTIRENANLFLIFPQDLKNVNHIFNDHVSGDMSKEEFKRLCKECWRRDHNFLTIDLTNKVESGKKYRKNFENFYFVDTDGSKI